MRPLISGSYVRYAVVWGSVVVHRGVCHLTKHCEYGCNPIPCNSIPIFMDNNVESVYYVLRTDKHIKRAFSSAQGEPCVLWQQKGIADINRGAVA